VRARIKAANIISRSRGTLDGEGVFDALDMQFIVEYEQGAKSIRSELKNLYTGNQTLSGSCLHSDNADYLRCMIQVIRAFAPNSAFTFKAHLSAEFPLDIAKTVMAEFPPGVVDAPVNLRICRFLPTLNEYSMIHANPTWKYVWVHVLMALLTAPVHVILFGPTLFTQPKALLAMLAVNWKACC
jgi:hypothetical protein